VADLLQRGQVWLAEKLQQYSSRPVTYVRGSLSVVVPATLGISRFEQTDAHGLRTISEVSDYLIPTHLLVLDGTATLPERGDLIRDTYGDTVHVFEVVAVGNEPPFRFADPYRTLLRIHVREIDTEPLS